MLHTVVIAHSFFLLSCTITLRRPERAAYMAYDAKRGGCDVDCIGDLREDAGKLEVVDADGALVDAGLLRHPRRCTLVQISVSCADLDLIVVGTAVERRQ